MIRSLLLNKVKRAQTDRRRQLRLGRSRETMRFSTDTPWRPSSGFTLIELLVMIALMAILATVIFPQIQASRQRETLVKADQRIKQISSATLAHYEEHGVWPDSFAQLQQLEPDLKAKLVDDAPVEGSKFRLRTVQRAVEVSSEPANPMRITQRLAVMLDGKAVVDFRKDGSLPETVYTKDEVATREHSLRTQRILGEFFETVMKICDCDQAEASAAIDESQQDVSTRDAAWALIDQNEDGYVTKDEIFDQPWEGIPLYGAQVRSFIDFSEVALEIEDDEEPQTRVADGGRWRHMLLGTIGNQLDLVTTTRRTHNELNNLYEVLGHANDSMLRADLAEAIGNVARFQQKLETLVTAGVVSKDQADLTLNTAGLLRANLTRTLEKVPASLWTPPGSAPLHVDWTAPPDEDVTGGEEDPFPDVVGALAYAARRAFPAVEIIVHPGIYGGALEITRDTRISSAEGRDTSLLIGCLLNEGPFDLELVDLWLASDDERPGILRVNHPDATTYLRNVRLDKALGFAIHQSGGDFRCHQLRVERTDAYSIDVGVAIQFDEGAQVELNDVAMTANQTAALLISGPTTEARATRLDIRGTRANPFSVDRIQEQLRGNADYSPGVIQPNTHAVDVRGGARFEAEFVSLVDNEYVGVLVHGDAKASLSDVWISRTRSPRQLRDHNFSYNVAVSGATGPTARLYMTNFFVADAQQGVHVAGDNTGVVLRGLDRFHSWIDSCTAGLLMRSSPGQGPWAYLNHVTIAHCTVGVAGDGAILEDVDFVHTEADERRGRLPLSGLTDPLFTIELNGSTP